MKRKKRSISDKERLDFILAWMNNNPAISINGARRFARVTVDAAIIVGRASRKESK